MITFKQFLLETDEEDNTGASPEYLAMQKKWREEYERDAKEANRNFKTFHGNEYLDDEGYEKLLRNQIFRINKKLWEFEQWLVDNFKVKWKDIEIRHYNSYRVNGSKFIIRIYQGRKHDDGFTIKMMLKAIPTKWKQLIPEFELKNVHLHPEFDPDNPGGVYRIYAQIEPNYNVGLNELYFNSMNPEHEENELKSRMANYRHNRTQSWKQHREDEEWRKKWAAQ